MCTPDFFSFRYCSRAPCCAASDVSMQCSKGTADSGRLAVMQTRCYGTHCEVQTISACERETSGLAQLRE
jgi:hypothetical protein